MPHVRIRPKGANGKGALRGLELDLESVRINVFRPFVELAGHLDREGAAVQQSVKGRLGDVVAASDARTRARLAHQFSHGMEKVDVVTSQVVDALEGCQRWPLQAVVADQTARTTAQFFCST